MLLHYQFVIAKTIQTKYFCYTQYNQQVNIGTSPASYKAKCIYKSVMRNQFHTGGKNVSDPTKHTSVNLQTDRR